MGAGASGVSADWAVRPFEFPRPLSLLWVSPGQLEERAEQIRSKSHIIQVEREKMQMELSHKRARVELERAATSSARSYEVGAASQPRSGGHASYLRVPDPEERGVSP